MIVRISMIVVLTAAIAAVATAADPVAKTTSLQEPIVLPTAGVKLAIPKGFELNVSGGAPGQFVPIVMHAMNEIRGGIHVRLWLEMYPMEADQTVEQLVEKIEKALSARKGTVDFKVAARSQIRAGNVSGPGRMYSFARSDVPTWTGRVYFVRPAVEGQKRYCYVLSTEGPRSVRMQIVPALRSAARSLEWIAPQTVSQAAGQSAIVPFKFRQMQLELKLPPTWYVAPIVAGRALKGFHFLQMDFFGLGGPVPVGLLDFERVDVSATPKLMAEGLYAELRRAVAAQERMETYQLGTLEANIGSLPGYQIAMEQYPRDQATTSPATTQTVGKRRIVVIRVGRVKPPEGSRTTLAARMMITAYDRPSAVAKKLMSEVASSFQMGGMPGKQTTPAPKDGKTDAIPSPAPSGDTEKKAPAPGKTSGQVDRAKPVVTVQRATPEAKPAVTVTDIPAVKTVDPAAAPPAAAGGVRMKFDVKPAVDPARPENTRPAAPAAAVKPELGNLKPVDDKSAIKTMPPAKSVGQPVPAIRPKGATTQPAADVKVD